MIKTPPSACAIIEVPVGREWQVGQVSLRSVGELGREAVHAMSCWIRKLGRLERARGRSLGTTGPRRWRARLCGEGLVGQGKEFRFYP